MTDPFVMAVTAAVGKFAEESARQVHHAAMIVVQRLRMRFRKRTDGTSGLGPAGGASQPEPESVLIVAESAVSNVFHGSARKSVQLRDLHGRLDI